MRQKRDGTRRGQLVAIAAIALVEASYLAILYYRNVRALRDVRAHWARELARDSGTAGIIWLFLVAGVAGLIVSLLTRRRFISLLLVLGILGGCVVLESSAIVETRKFNLMIEGMYNLRDVGLKISAESNSSINGLPAELPPRIVADRGFRDGWGHPLRYVRISPDHAFLIAPGSDGRIEANPQAIKRETFPPSRFEHDIIFEIAEREPRFVVYPDGPEQGTACTIYSAFACLQYWR